MKAWPRWCWSVLSESLLWKLPSWPLLDVLSQTLTLRFPSLKFEDVGNRLQGRCSPFLYNWVHLIISLSDWWLYQTSFVICQNHFQSATFVSSSGQDLPDRGHSAPTENPPWCPGLHSSHIFGFVSIFSFVPGLHQAATYLTLSTSGCCATPTAAWSSTRRDRCSKPSSATCSCMATARPGAVGRPTSGICIRWAPVTNNPLQHCPSVHCRNNPYKNLSWLRWSRRLCIQAPGLL